MKYAVATLLLSASALVSPAARAAVEPELRGWYVLPAVASASGEFGAYFRTDVTLVNPYVFHDVDVRIWLLRNDADNTVAPVAGVRLKPTETLVLRDVVSSLFAETGGASLVLSSTDGLVFSCSARTYTGTAGTNGFAGPGHAVAHVGRAEVITPGLRSGQGFRTNLGLVSLSTFPVTVDVNVFGPSGGLGTKRITLPPWGRTQFRVSEIAPDFENAWALWSGVTSSVGASWIPFATVIDNTSGDSVYVHDVADRAATSLESRYDLEGEWTGEIVRPTGRLDVTVFLRQVGPRLDATIYETAGGALYAELEGSENKGAIEASGAGARLPCLSDALAVTGRVADRSHVDLELVGTGCFSGRGVLALVKKTAPAAAAATIAPAGSPPRAPARAAR